MTDATILTVAKDSIVLTLIVSAPYLLAALIVGLVISILQAVTQIQEMTLTFVPKILAIILVFMLTLPWMLKKMTTFTQHLILNIPFYIK